MKTLANVGASRETPLHCLKFFRSKIKMIEILSFPTTCEKNFLIDNQYVVGFYNGWFKILDKNANSFCKRCVLKSNFTTQRA